MARTFGDVVRAVRLHCPLADPFLVESWVQGAYNEICDRRRWSHLRTEAEFVVADQKTGTCQVTLGSPTVIPGTLTFAASDVGRQFQVSGPPYTILSLSGANAVLDRSYGLATDVAATAKILDAYITLPEDFGSFWFVHDPVQQLMLFPWATEDQINFRDSQRSETGDPRLLASRSLDASGLARYELWPYQLSARRFPYIYSKRPEILTWTSTFSGPLRQRDDIVRLFALAECAGWPGTAEKRNPYFQLGLQDQKRKQAEAALDLLQTRDEEVYLTWYELEAPAWVRMAHAGHGGSANWLREHEA